MTEKGHDCSKCENPSEHSLLVRLGKNPSPLDPKAGDRDKTRLKVFRFCETHWAEVKACFPGLT